MMNGTNGGLDLQEVLSAVELAGALSPRVEKLYTVNEAAELLSMHPESLRREIRAGEVRAEKLGPRRTRIAESELLRFRRDRSARYGGQRA
jgi:excisionase family DNA binding protein